MPRDQQECISVKRNVTDEEIGVPEEGDARNMKVLEILSKFIGELGQIKQQHDETKVVIAFNKFDKDGSGAIDAQELQAVSSELGQPLSEEQLATALKDLDLNGDGVIDLKEFKRWYYSGMKSYTGSQMNYLKALGGIAAFNKAVADPRVLEFVKENPETIT